MEVQRGRSVCVCVSCSCYFSPGIFDLSSKPAFWVSQHHGVFSSCLNMSVHIWVWISLVMLIVCVCVCVCVCACVCVCVCVCKRKGEKESVTRGEHERGVSHQLIAR